MYTTEAKFNTKVVLSLPCHPCKNHIVNRLFQRSREFYTVVSLVESFHSSSPVKLNPHTMFLRLKSFTYYLSYSCDTHVHIPNLFF